LKDTKYGFRLPAGIEIFAVTETYAFSNDLDKEDFIKYRLAQLGIAMNVEPSLFKLKSRAGCMAVEKHVIKTEHCILHEHRLFQLVITNRKKLPISEEFAEDVKSTLPDAYDRNNPKHRSAFEEFFDVWGHCVILSAFGGGSFEFRHTFNGKKEHHATWLDTMKKIESRIICGFPPSSTHEKLSELTLEQIAWRGGAIMDVHSIGLVTHEDWRQWKKSLASHSVLLDTKMEVLKISKVVERVDKQKGMACQDALEDILGGGKIRNLPKEDVKQKQQKKTLLNMKTNKSIADVIQPTDSGACFPEMAMVLLECGRHIPMAQLRSGDRIAAMSGLTNQLVFSEVLVFLDRDPDCQHQFVTLLTDQGSRLSLTQTHLIYVAAEDKEESSLSCFKPIYAGSVTVGQHVLVLGKKGHDASSAAFQIEVVMSVSMDRLRGAYAPLTAAGTIIVDDVVASCYADIDSQRVAHAAFLPLRWSCCMQKALCCASAALHWRSSSVSSFAGSVEGIQSTTEKERSAVEALQVGLHWYPAALISLARWILPGHLSSRISKEKGK
jgi:hypothetical protein